VADGGEWRGEMMGRYLGRFASLSARHIHVGEVERERKRVRNENVKP
jgi:hypothetical protein